MFKQHEYINKIELVGFPDRRNGRKLRGVYSFGYSYIGASVHIRGRIIQHLRVYFKEPHKLNPRLKEYLDKCFEKGEKPRVYFMSENPYDEMEVTKIVNPEVGNLSKFYHQTFNKGLRKR